MSAFTTVGTSRLGKPAHCMACGAGATISFNWAYAQEHGMPGGQAQVSTLFVWRSLRRGTLYRCHFCQEVWHLDGDGEFMTYVDESRLELVLAWDRSIISLPPEISAKMQMIGPTPPDLYGNGGKQRVTPCLAETLAGEVLELAMICIQRDAPIQTHQKFRLGSELLRIDESRFALPLEVRRASSRAEEMRMGFSPSIIEMPDGRRFVLNGTSNFMVKDGYDAREAKVAGGNFFREEPRPSLMPHPEGIPYFVVDGDPGWIRDDKETPTIASQPAKRRGWLQKLIRR